MNFNKTTIPMMVALASIIGVSVLSPNALADDHLGLNSNLQLIGQSILLPVSAPPVAVVEKTITVIATGYSSTIDQTDESPFITASNSIVRDGIVANNLLAFGTKVRLPELFGDKVFEVDDRMHSRKGNFHVDVWFPTTEQAKQFGAKIAVLEVLSD